MPEPTDINQESSQAAKPEPKRRRRDHWLSTEVLDAMGLCMFFAATGVMTTAILAMAHGGGIAAASAILLNPFVAVGMATLLIAGAAFYALAAKEHSQIKEGEEKQVSGPEKGKVKTIEIKISRVTVPAMEAYEKVEQSSDFAARERQRRGGQERADTALQRLKDERALAEMAAIEGATR